MPLTLTLTEGVLPPGAEKQAVEQITDAMLQRHSLTGNKVMTPNVTATVHVLPKESTFSGGQEFAGAWVEWKVPSFAFASREVQQGFSKTRPTSFMNCRVENNLETTSTSTSSTQSMAPGISTVKP